MSKKEFVIILVLSITIAIFLPIVAFIAGLSAISDGAPLRWTSFSFFGSRTDYIALVVDIIFWFIVVFGIWKLISRSSGRGGRSHRK